MNLSTKVKDWAASKTALLAQHERSVSTFVTEPFSTMFPLRAETCLRVVTRPRLKVPCVQEICIVPSTVQLQKKIFIVFEIGDINFCCTFFDFVCCFLDVWAAELIDFGIKRFLYTVPSGLPP